MFHIRLPGGVLHKRVPLSAVAAAYAALIRRRGPLDSSGSPPEEAVAAHLPCRDHPLHVGDDPQASPDGALPKLGDEVGLGAEVAAGRAFFKQLGLGPVQSVAQGSGRGLGSFWGDEDSRGLRSFWGDEMSTDYVHFRIFLSPAIFPF